MQAVTHMLRGGHEGEFNDRKAGAELSVIILPCAGLFLGAEIPTLASTGILTHSMVCLRNTPTCPWETSHVFSMFN